MGRKNNGAAAAIAGVSFRSGKESRAIKIRAAHGIFAENAALRPENAGGVLNIIIKTDGAFMHCRFCISNMRFEDAY